MPIRYVVDELAVQSFLLPGQPVHRETSKVIRAITTSAKMMAPRRTGTLERGIMSVFPKRSGTFTINGFVTSTARHSLWVHEGTLPRISGGGKMMRVPRQKGNVRGAMLPSDKTFPRGSVRGQRPNPFLRRAVPPGMAACGYIV